MDKIECIEYNLSLFEDLTFMERNIIRYVFMKQIMNNYEIKISHIENFIPIYINNKISHYKLSYLYKKNIKETLLRISIDTPIYINPYKILKTSLFFICLKIKEKFQKEDKPLDEIHTEYFMNYENYPPTEHLL